MATKELDPADITVICDTREQLPYNLAPLRMERAGLATGDYSVKGLEHLVSIERKSLSDLIGCVGVERDRFDAEMQRILAYPCRCLVVEAGWTDMVAGAWRSKVTPQAAMGSLLGWMMAGVPVALFDNREEAERAVARMLFLAARRRWREAVSLLPTLRIENVTKNA